MAGTREGRGRQVRLLKATFLSCLTLMAVPFGARAQIQPIELEGLIITGTPVPRTVGSEASQSAAHPGKTGSTDQGLGGQNHRTVQESH